MIKWTWISYITKILAYSTCINASKYSNKRIYEIGGWKHQPFWQQNDLNSHKIINIYFIRVTLLIQFDTQKGAKEKLTLYIRIKNIQKTQAHIHIYWYPNVRQKKICDNRFNSLSRKNMNIFAMAQRMNEKNWCIFCCLCLSCNVYFKPLD